MNDFTHFIDAQAKLYATAVAELRAGRKREHWIWFVFPQLPGLGSSTTSERFAIAGVATARAYLAHAILGSRYRECVDVVYDQVCMRHRTLVVLMGSQVDALKLVSSLTLFADVAEKLPQFSALAERANSILDVAETQGVPRCQRTMDVLDDE